MSKEAVKLVHGNVNKRGQLINIPIDGDVQIDENGELEVSEEAAEFLLNRTNDFSKVESEVKSSKKSKKKEEEEEEDDDDDEEDDDDEDDEDSEEGYKREEDDSDDDGLDSLELADLIDSAKQAGFDAKEYKKFKTSKKLMINFLRKKSK